jgi:hypothetical protein
MGFKLNPFTGKLDAVDSPNGVFEEIEVNGDITLDGRFISSLNGAASAPPAPSPAPGSQAAQLPPPSLRC